MKNLSRQTLEKIVDRLIQQFGQSLQSRQELEQILNESYTSSQKERIWYRYQYKRK